MSNRQIIIMPMTPTPSTEDKRQTVVQDTRTKTTVHVIGGTSEVHDCNVALATEIAQLPNDKTFTARIRRIFERLGLTP